MQDKVVSRTAMAVTLVVVLGANLLIDSTTEVSMWVRWLIAIALGIGASIATTAIMQRVRGPRE
ncbi:hypothetical protein [Serinibacter salmoneus]|uniref:Uncharacterized protein n=1 Tax=Serinibacter salmoneus TaxID=556530 RepID=A0A2A9D4G2_9MICO|nr:hypothetical protein [Serinibacter salmoneus]PFG21216.1 hypothetical protein ATL40_2839 [Serinibacter salmoneus]